MQFETENERLIRMITYAGEQGLLDNTPEFAQKILEGEKTENQYVMDFATHSYGVQPLSSDIQEIYENIDLDTATGAGLDKLGKLENVTRYPAQAPEVAVSVTLGLENPNDVIIPAGTPVLIEGMSPEMYGEYQTRDEVVINAGTTQASFIAVGVDLGVRPALPASAVTGVQGFSFISCTNPNAGTSGRNIEEDDDYRQRIRQAISINTRGTRACIEDWLDHFDGISSYYLVPCFDGVGTLKVVCDTIAENIPSITNGLYNECMIATDEEPVVVLPDTQTLRDITLTVLRNPATVELTNDELTQLLVAQTTAFIIGGYTRDGLSRAGLGVGGDLYPSELVFYLMNTFPECLNISLDIDEVVEVPPTSKLGIGSITVVFDDT